jgi:hypothetical protein
MTHKTAIRVAVGTPKTIQSSIWRFWNDAEELYVVARESRMVYKISLHSSGIARLAYLKERDIRDPLIVDNDPRVIYRWRPGTFIDGWMRRLDIVVPAVPVTKYFSLAATGEPKGAIQWLETLSRGDRYQLTLLVADSPSRTPDDIRLEGDQLIGSLPLPSGRVGWIRTRREKMPKAEMERSENFANDMRINYDSDPGEVFAALIMVDKDSPHPVITNFTLGWEHVIVKDSGHKTIA